MSGPPEQPKSEPPESEEGPGTDAGGADETRPLESTLSAPEPAASSRKSEPLPEKIGPYRILEYLDSGGFGEVYRAEQRGAIRRQVAVKVIKAGMDTKQVLARFDAEKNALSLMNHPNIARVLDSGQTDEGRPYFAMEYVDGTPFTEFCQRERLPLEERLRLFQQVCRGVQHAHTKGVVHRDLKPANVLITRHEGTPTPKIIDFGLAKALSQPLTDMTMVTQQRQIVGTLEYMSPEQARTGGSDVDTKTDVYSLGVLLYELLVDERPFTDLRTRTDAEILQIICKQDPPRPSQRVSQLDPPSSARLAESRGLDSHRLLSRLRGELDWIVMKALEKQRDRRYESPLDLAADLERHIGGQEAVLARPPSAMYRVKKFTRQYRRGLAGAALLIVALTGGMTWALVERNGAINSRAQVLRLSDIKLLTEYLAEAEVLWPAHPEKNDELNSWLGKARDLHHRLPLHEMALAKLELGRQNTKESSEDAWQRESLAGLVLQLKQLGSENGTIADVESRLSWASKVKTLTVSGQEAAAAWEAAISSIADRDACPLYDGYALTPQLGLFPLDRNPRTKLWEFWHPQTGARPVPNLDWDPATPGRCNRWLIDDETGLVFVLIPGGTFRMGAEQPKIGLALEEDPEGLRVTSVVEHSLAARAGVEVGDNLRSLNGISTPRRVGLAACKSTLLTGEQAQFGVLRGHEELTLTATVEEGVGSPNIDPWCRRSDSPVHSVSLRPYFLSKYEMTQGQWSRGPAKERDPSYFKAGSRLAGQMITSHDPVENVTWNMCADSLGCLGLGLPTEAQWERGCRAGTETAYWSGDLIADLQGVANIADAYAKWISPTWNCTLQHDDGYVMHAPVGSLRANGFGLHEVHGGVREWCQDNFRDYTTEVTDADGLHSSDHTSALRVHRGGSFFDPAEISGSAVRFGLVAEFRDDNLGVRPARTIESFGR